MTAASSALARAIAAWNEGRRSDYLDVYAEDIVLHGAKGDLVGRDRVRERYEDLWQRYDSHVELDDVISEGSRVACRYRLIARSKATGTAFWSAGLSILHFSDGRCIERWDLGYEAVITSQGAPSAPGQ